MNPSDPKLEINKKIPKNPQFELGARNKARKQHSGCLYALKQFVVDVSNRGIIWIDWSITSIRRNWFVWMAIEFPFQKVTEMYVFISLSLPSSLSVPFVATATFLENNIPLCYRYNGVRIQWHMCFCSSHPGLHAIFRSAFMKMSSK